MRLIYMSNNNVNIKCYKSYKNYDYPVDINSDIPHELRSKDAQTQVLPPPKNGGLFSGPQSNAPWMPKPVPPTTTYLMQALVKNADPPPPPGASEQYPGTNRLGNNYVAMPGVVWFNSAYDNRGPYKIKVIDDRNYNNYAPVNNQNKNQNNNNYYFDNGLLNN